MTTKVILQSTDRVNPLTSANNCEFYIDWSSILDEGKYSVDYSICMVPNSSNVSLQVELGQDTVMTTSPTQVVARNTRELGRFHPRIDVNQTIILKNRPSNNIFSVVLFDNLTNSVSTDNHVYIIQLSFEKL